jgi:hypothetical protein
MNPIRRSRLIRRTAGVLTGLAVPVAPITTGSAALASPLRADPPAWLQRPPGPAHLPPLPPGWDKHPPLPGPVLVHTAPAGGMAGWQITLIAGPRSSSRSRRSSPPGCVPRGEMRPQPPRKS